jgi:hypothetical protein
MFGPKSRALGVATLLGALALPTASRCAEPVGVSRGQRIRLTPPRRVEIPGLITLEGERRQATGQVREEDGGALVVVESEGRTLHVPAPGRVLVGELVAADERSVTILRHASAKEITVPRQAIESMAVSTGHRSRWHGAAILGGVGLALGAALGAAAASGDDDMLSAGEVAAGLGGLFGLLGAGIGAAIPPGERWDIVDVGTVRVSCRPALSGRGPGLSITLAF